MLEQNLGMQPAAGTGLLFAYAFAGQIYCDFSAYTDIARGVAKCFNVELTRNFLTPYFASSPSDFWRRWHISLSTWLRDYLYIPLGGDRHGRLKTLRNLFITMLIGGFWHGAGIGFIAWGFYHGLLLVIYRVGQIEERIRKLLGNRLGNCIGIILMFHLTCTGWIFFRAKPEHIYNAFSSIAALLHTHKIDYVLRRDFGYALLAYSAPLLLTECIAYAKKCEFVDLYVRCHWLVRTAIYVLIFYAVIFFGAREQNEFIYFQF